MNKYIQRKDTLDKDSKYYERNEKVYFLLLKIT